MHYSKINKLIVFIALTQLLSACSTLHSSATPPAQDEKITILPQSYENAINAIKAGKSTEAEKLFTDITKTDPGFANAYTNLGLLHLKKKETSKAEDAFRKAITLNPQDSVAYNHLGILLREKGEFNESKAMYIQAIKHKSNYAIAYLNLGILYDLYLHELDEALVQYKQYQTITNNDDKLIDKWIIDLEQRIKSGSKG